MQKPTVIYTIDIGDVYTRGGFYAGGQTREVAQIITPRTSREFSGEQNLLAGIEEMIARIEVDAPPLEALAVSASGVMTVQSRPDARQFGPFKNLELYVLAPNVDGLKYIPILSRLESLGLGVPIHVENDVNAAMISVSEIDDGILINLGGGLGAAAKKNRVIQRIEGTWSCCEIGHGTRWDLPEYLTRRCHCGNTGCLEAAIGGWAMAERYGFRPESAPPDIYAQMRVDVLELLPHAIASVIRQTGICKIVLAGKGLLGYQESDSQFIEQLRSATELVESSGESIEMSLIQLTETAELQGSALALLSYFDQ